MQSPFSCISGSKGRTSKHSSANGVNLFAAGRIPVGLGAGAAMAAVSAFMDAGGQRTRAPTGREYLPYPRENRDY